MDNEKFIGWLSLLFGSLILISSILMIANIIKPAGSVITAILMIIGFYYVAYETLIKKQKVSRGGWITIAILFILFLLPFFLLL